MDSDEFLQANQVLECCASTNDVAKRLAEKGYPHGTWISARTQSSGRGRLGREWQSISGNLFLSFVARISEKSLWSWVPLTVAVGIVRFLRGYFASEIPFEIKWPNDLWVRGAKLGGILCEGGGSSPGGKYIIVGMGLNCVSSPEGLDRSVCDLTALSEAVGIRKTPDGIIKADDIRTTLLGSVIDELRKLETSGSASISKDYASWAVFRSGTRVEWGSSQKKQGTVVGLGPYGELEVREEKEGLVRLYAEDVEKIKAASPTTSGGFPL